MTHKIHEIWKDGREWKLQAPKGILTFKTKKAANEWKRVFDSAIKTA